MRAAAILIAGLALLATASAGRDLVSSRSLLQTAGIESVADAVAQQPVVPQMVSLRANRRPVHMPATLSLSLHRAPVPLPFRPVNHGAAPRRAPLQSREAFRCRII